MLLNGTWLAADARSSGESAISPANNEKLLATTETSARGIADARPSRGHVIVNTASGNIAKRSLGWNVIQHVGARLRRSPPRNLAGQGPARPTIPPPLSHRPTPAGKPPLVCPPLVLRLRR